MSDLERAEGSKEGIDSGRRGDLVSLILVAAAIFGGWYGFTAILQTPTPFFVVSSGSMIPTLEVGDLILVNGAEKIESLKVGDIIVFNLPTNQERVIVHRVNRVANSDGDIGLITKGDNNPSPDGWVVRRRDYIGKVIFSVPSIGYLAIWLSPPLNYYAVALIILVIIALEVGPGRKGESREGPARYPGPSAAQMV